MRTHHPGMRRGNGRQFRGLSAPEAKAVLLLSCWLTQLPAALSAAVAFLRLLLRRRLLLLLVVLLRLLSLLPR